MNAFETGKNKIIIKLVNGLIKLYYFLELGVMNEIAQAVNDLGWL